MKRLLAFTLALIAGVAASGKTPEQNLAKGFAVDKSYELKDLGSISTFNGNLGVTIPLGLRYQVSSALSYQMALTYGGNVWLFESTKKPGKFDPLTGEIPEVIVEWAYPDKHTDNGRVLRNMNAGLGWNVTLGFIETGKDPNGYVSPDGARHTFWSKLNDQTVVTPGVFYTRDGSYLRKTTADDGLTQIEFPDGTRHRFDPTTGRIRLMLDRFGNQVTISYAPGVNCATDPTDCAEDWTIDDGFRTHKVDLKRFPASGSDSYGYDVVKSITFAHGTADATTYTLSYGPSGAPETLLPVSRQLAKRQDCQVSRYILAAVLHTVTLPDGSTYEITTDRGHAAVEPDPAKILFAEVDESSDPLFVKQDCSNTNGVWETPSVTGHVVKIKRPTGAATEWTYQPYSFPPFVPPSSDCLEALTGCRFPVSGRAAVGVRERIDYSRGATPTMLSKTSYASSFLADNDLTNKKTTVTTYDNLNGIWTAVSSSEHYYSTHFTKFDSRQKEYGLPYSDTTLSSQLPSTETSNPDAGGRYLSTKTYDGSKLVSYTFVKYEGDSSTDLDNPATVNRRVLSERTVHLAADGTITNEVTRNYTDYDGFGHFRTVRTTTGRNSSPAIDRTVTTNYNKADASTGGVNETSAEWILGTYSSETVSENTVNADGLLERRSTKSLFLFDRATGFLKRRRTLKTISSEVRPASAPVTDPPFTTEPAVPLHANDLAAEFAQVAGNVTSEAYYGGDQQTLGTGSLATLPLSNPEFSMRHTYSVGVLATTQYVGAAFKSADRTINSANGLPSSSRDPSGIETAYEYDWGGRLVWSVPAGGAATEYVYTAPVSGPPEVTIRQRNGGKTAPVMATAVVKYDDLGRVSTETRSMPNGVNSSRRTTYNGRGLVAAISEWGSTALTTDYTYDALGRVLTASATS